MRVSIIGLLFVICSLHIFAQIPNYYRDNQRIYLDSQDGHHGQFKWQMYKAVDISAPAEEISKPDYQTVNWMPAVVPGTILNSLE